jgi:hypothetical protein
MTTLSEFQATRKTFDLDADQPADEHQFHDDLAAALSSTGWADFELSEAEKATAAYFYQFTHSDNLEPARYIIVRDDRGGYISSWAMGAGMYATLEAAEEDLLRELNG